MGYHDEDGQWVVETSEYRTGMVETMKSGSRNRKPVYGYRFVDTDKNFIQRPRKSNMARGGKRPGAGRPRGK